MTLTEEASIRKLDRGYVVSFSDWRHEDYVENSYACADPPEVLMYLLGWLGVDPDVADKILEVLEEASDIVYTITPKGRRLLEGREGEEEREI